MHSVQVLAVVVGEGWELSFFSIVVLRVVSVFVQVLVVVAPVGVSSEQESVERRTLGLILNLIFTIVVLEHLLVGNVVHMSWLLNHCCFRLEIWPCVPVVSHIRVIGDVGSKGKSDEDKGIGRVSSEVLPCCLIWADLGIVRDPPIVWNDWNSSLVGLGPPANSHG